MLYIGGVLVDPSNPKAGFLVRFPIGYVPTGSLPAKIVCDSDRYQVLPSFEKATEDVRDWLRCVGELHWDVQRCDQTEMIAIEDASAQVAFAFAWSAVVNQCWYLPLLEGVVMTGVLLGDEKGWGRLVDPNLGTTDVKVARFNEQRRISGHHFWALVIPSNRADPQYDVRVLRVVSMGDIERKLLEVWGRAALSRMLDSLVLLDFLMGAPGRSMIWVFLTALLWYVLPGNWFLAGLLCFAVFLCYWIRSSVRKDLRRLDDEERKDNRHSAPELEDPFPANANCSTEGWLAMLSQTKKMDKPSYFSRAISGWAVTQLQKSNRSSPHSLSKAPATAWRKSAPYLISIIMILGSILFFVACPLAVALAEMVPTEAVLDHVGFYYDTITGRTAPATISSDGVRSVGRTGVVIMYARGKHRAGQRIRVSCSAKSGAESNDVIPGKNLPQTTCRVGDQNGSTVLALDEAGEVKVPYQLFPPPGNLDFVVNVELVTHYNTTLKSIETRLRYDPELSKPVQIDLPSKLSKPVQIDLPSKGAQQ